MMNYYRSLEEMIEMIDSPDRERVSKLLETNYELFSQAPGSTNNHQAWKGGYLGHIQEVMNLAVVLFQMYSNLRFLPFRLSDALLVLFLHDLEKPWLIEEYESGKWRRKAGSKDKKVAHQFRLDKISEFGIELTPDQENALEYVEGEHKQYTNTSRVMGPLAAFCHLCDVTSARIWFDYPQSDSKLWRGTPSQINRS